jgi:hypothetical protein
VPACSPETSAFAGTRDQNIYTSRITDGLQVSTPQNSKYLLVNQPVGFVIAAANATGSPMRVAFEAPVFDPSLLIATDANPTFTYLAGGTLARVEVDIAPHSAVHRTLFVTQAGTDSHRTIHVTVNEVSFDGKSCGTACRSGALTFNAPVALNTLAWSNPASDPNLKELYVATVGNPTISNPTISNPTISNPTISNPTISNPTISNPTISNPTISNPTISNPTISNPTISNPTISNPTISNPTISNPTISNSAMSDLSYTVQNDGNTTSNYHVKVVAKDPSKVPSPLQLIVTKVYKTPGAVGCELKEVAHDEVVTSVPDINKRPAANGAPQTDLVKPTDPVRPDPSAPTISNATLALAPGESAVVTLRALVEMDQLAKVASEQGLVTAPVAAATPVTNMVTYQDWGTLPGQKPFIKLPSATALTSVPNLTGTGSTWTATVTPGAATGTVTFVYGSVVVGAVPLATGTATLAFDPGLTNPNIANANLCNPSLTNPNIGTPGASGACPLWNRATNPTMVAFYSGDATYAASSSNAVVAPVRALRMGVQAQSIGTFVFLYDQNGPVTSAVVTLNGMSVDPAGTGGGTYYFTYPSMNPGAAIAVVATVDGTQTATATGTLPSAPSLLTPVNMATILRSNPLTMTWTDVAARYVVQAACDLAPCGANNIQVTSPVVSYTYPPNTFPTGAAMQFWVTAVNDLTVVGATNTGSYATAAAFSNATVARLPMQVSGIINSDGYISIYVADGLGGPGITDAVVALNGTALNPEGVGYYRNSLNAFTWPAPLQTLTLTVTRGTQQATGTMTVSNFATVLSPVAGATYSVASPITVSWTPNTPPPDQFAVAGTCTAANWVCGGPNWAPTVVYGPPSYTTTSTIPAGTLPGNNTVHLHLYAQTRIPLAGLSNDVLPGTYVNVNTTTFVDFFTTP